ncbi:unnamed protein product, partial [Prorocentrum cordatum]
PFWLRVGSPAFRHCHFWPMATLAARMAAGAAGGVRAAAHASRGGRTARAIGRQVGSPKAAAAGLWGGTPETARALGSWLLGGPRAGLAPGPPPGSRGQEGATRGAPSAERSVARGSSLAAGFAAASQGELAEAAAGPRLGALGVAPGVAEQQHGSNEQRVEQDAGQKVVTSTGQLKYIVIPRPAVARQTRQPRGRRVQQL